MNRVIMCLFPFLGWFVFRQVLYAGIRTAENGDDTTQSGRPNLIHWIIEKLADAFGAGQLPPSVISMIALGLILYSIVIGYFTFFLLHSRGFNRYLNGTFCLLGTFLSLYAYAKIMGPVTPERVVPVMIIAVAGSLATLFLACLIKAWISHEAESVMIGTYSKAARAKPTAKLAPSANARLNAIANRSRK